MYQYLVILDGFYWLFLRLNLYFFEGFEMQATAELQVIPLCSGVSVREQVTRVIKMLKSHDFILETHASGTNIEGELSDILAAVEQIHEALHKEGSVRLLSYLKLETRTDKTPTLAGKRLV